MSMYLAVCNDTNNVKMFTNYDEFKDFAVQNRYAYSYFELGDLREIPDVDLFYYE